MEINIERYVEYYDNDNVECEYYLLNEKYHREDGPARIDYYKNGNKKTVIYFINGEYHRMVQHI